MKKKTHASARKKVIQLSEKAPQNSGPNNQLGKSFYRPKHPHGKRARLLKRVEREKKKGRVKACEQERRKGSEKGRPIDWLCSVFLMVGDIFVGGRTCVRRCTPRPSKEQTCSRETKKWAGRIMYNHFEFSRRVTNDMRRELKESAQFFPPRFFVSSKPAERPQRSRVCSFQGSCLVWLSLLYRFDLELAFRASIHTPWHTLNSPRSR